jgi:hypothetical protein
VRCFHHHDQDAIAVCPACGKALCSSCAITGKFQRQLCSQACASRLEALDRTDQFAQLARPLIKAVLIFAGLLFLGGAALGWWHGTSDEGILLPAVAGLGALAAAFWIRRE